MLTPTGLPESVKSLRTHIAAADAIFFGLEEFNGSVSGPRFAHVVRHIFPNSKASA
jgi:hypothetical protein